MKKVTVIWEDSCTYGRWWEANTNFKTKECHTSGFLVEKTKKHVIIAGSITFGDKGEIDEFAQVIAIPRGCVKSIKSEKR